MCSSKPLHVSLYMHIGLFCDRLRVTGCLAIGQLHKICIFYTVYVYVVYCSWYKLKCENRCVFPLLNIHSIYFFYLKSHVLKHCQSIKFKLGPTAAITHYLVRTYASYGNRGGLEKGRPQLLQLSSGSSVTAQQWAADSDRLWNPSLMKTSAIIHLECSSVTNEDHQVSYHLHHVTPHPLHFGEEISHVALWESSRGN